MNPFGKMTNYARNCTASHVQGQNKPYSKCSIENHIGLEYLLLHQVEYNDVHTTHGLGPCLHGQHWKCFIFDHCRSFCLNAETTSVDLVDVGFCTYISIIILQHTHLYRVVTSWPHCGTDNAIHYMPATLVKQEPSARCNLISVGILQTAFSYIHCNLFLKFHLCIQSAPTARMYKGLG